MIKINNLNKYYNKKKSNEIHVINDVVLQLPDTGLVAMFGKSGCGKTTLLNAISGLDKFDSGNIEMFGTTIEKYKANTVDNLRNAHVGYIFQSYNLLEDKTVYENIELALSLAGVVDKKEKEERIKQVLISVGMYNYRKRMPTSLSGGQQQRVAIARALVKKPSLIIADEPTGNLDSENSIIVMDILKQISKSCLVLLVTHEPNLVDYYADRVIKLSDGAIVEDREINGNRTLNVSESNCVYLMDMSNHETIQSDNVNVDVYKDGENSDNVNVKVVIKDGKLYVKADTQNLKLIYVDNDCETKLLDKKFVKRESREDSFDKLDLSIIKPIEFKKKASSFYSWKDSIKHGFMNVLSKKKGFRKIIKAILLCVSSIGLVFSLSLLNTLFFPKPIEYKYTTDYVLSVSTNDYNTIKKYESYDCINYVTKAEYTVFNSIQFRNLYDPQSNSSIGTFTTLYNIPVSELDNKPLFMGRKPENVKEFVIDKFLIDVYKENFVSNDIIGGPFLYGYQEYEDFIGAKCNFNSSTDALPLDYTIVGISDFGAPLICVDEYEIVWNSKYVDDYLQPRLDTYLTDSALRQNYINNIRTNTYLPQFMDSQNQTVYIYTNDSKKAISILKNAYPQVGFANDIAKSEYIKNSLNNGDIYVTLIVLAILSGTSIVVLYFIMRSSLFSRIKEIGIMRAIGAKKNDIYKMFTWETLAITMGYNVPGYIIAAIMCAKLSRTIIYSTVSFNVFVGIISLLFIFGLNLLFGLLPINRLMTNTPSEILSKYDI